jgi:hypothetical protein
MSRRLKTYLKEFVRVLCKVGDCISYVWFLIPIGFYYGLRGAWLNMQTSPEVTDFYLDIVLLAFLLYVIATLFLLHRDKLVQFCIAAAVGGIMFLAMGFIGLALQSAPTSFAKNHPIPEGLAYHMPKAKKADLAEGVDPADSTTFLQLRNSFEGGIYQYSFYYPSLSEGVIWLRCYEVTKNLPLSESRITRKSCQQVKGTDHFACLVDAKEFTIYEGDWGDCYAARIEVWFADRKGQKRKLLEKIYGVEGWMR